jgi:hypothetical protein
MIEINNIFNKYNLRFVGLETVGLFDNFDINSNILLELGVGYISDNEFISISSVNKTDLEIDLEAMSIHNITTEISNNSPIFNKTKVYKDLYKLSINNANNNIIITYDKAFVSQVLKNAGINIESFKIIDLKQIITHLYMSDIINLIESPIKSINLNYLQYYFNIYEDINMYIKTSLKKNIKFENSLKKVILLKFITEYIIKEHNLTIDKILELDKLPVFLKFLKFKGEFQKIDTLTEHELIYLSNNHFDKNVIYTCSERLKQMGIELDKHLITSGKYKGYYVENIDDIEYLEWFSKNMLHLDKELINSVKNRINFLKSDKIEEKEYLVSIIERNDIVIVHGELPSNIREWLEKQPHIYVKYKKCEFVLTDNNIKRQNLILDKLKNSVKVIKIEKQ